MNGSAGSSRQKGRKQELTGSNGAVRASKTESGDPVVGLAVRIVEIIAIVYAPQNLVLLEAVGPPYRRGAGRRYRRLDGTIQCHVLQA